jgi:hypothetical protein
MFPDKSICVDSLPDQECSAGEVNHIFDAGILIRSIKVESKIFIDGTGYVRIIYPPKSQRDG